MFSEKYDEIFEKLALEAFDMVLEGEVDKAKTVFSALSKVRSGSRAPALGLAMIELGEIQKSEGSGSIARLEYDDKVMRCFQGLILLNRGHSAYARSLLESVAQGEDPEAAKFARDIIKFQIEGT